jgi:CDP-diacylglycerol--serine O-phosphatidyltransferase
MASPADPFDRRNLLTYLSLLCGVGAVAAASAGRAWTAGLAIAIAVIADTFDGRFARRFGSDPRRNALGTELDSLSDAIAFGIAPPLCSVLLLNAGLGPVGLALWIAVFVHAACAVTRLASFNVDATESPKGHFVGIPVPLAALIWSTALLVQPTAAVTLGVILVTAAAMVLPIRLPRPTGAGLAVFVLWPLAVALLHATR